MSEPVQYVAAKVSFSTQMLAMLNDGQAMQKMIAGELDHVMIEMMNDHKYGPRLGPNRHQYDEIMRPARKRAALRATALALMPGKRPGKFVRL